jgi:hypothetical protein
VESNVARHTKLKIIFLDETQNAKRCRWKAGNGFKNVKKNEKKTKKAGTVGFSFYGSPKN